LKKYLNTLDSIDTAYYEAVNRKKGLTKVIILPLDASGGAHVGFTVQEFETLKTVIRSYVGVRNVFAEIYCQHEGIKGFSVELTGAERGLKKMILRRRKPVRVDRHAVGVDNSSTVTCLCPVMTRL
jgi:hypothetical protein